MLMKIDPLPMRGSLVMTMVMISPSRREVPRQNSSARALDWFCQGSASWRWSFVPKACLRFFQGKRLHIAEDGHQRAARWPTRQGARLGGRVRPHPSGWLMVPCGAFFAQYFLYIPKIFSVKFQDFWSCAE